LDWKQDNIDIVHPCIILNQQHNDERSQALTVAETRRERSAFAAWKRTTLAYEKAKIQIL
jgi:hypothetical protein